MPQTFDRRSALLVRLVGLVLALLLPAAWGWAVWRDGAWEQLGEPVSQPVPFSHKHHVGDDGIDCRYCHTGVETGRHAGLPSAATCLSCHSQLYTDAALLAPLHDSVRTGRPLAWRRVHTLPDFVYFNHAPHVAAGVACSECHGRVEQMPLTWRAERLQMQWCLDCHRDPLPRLRAGSGPTPVALPSRRRLSDCSTCHR